MKCKLSIDPIFICKYCAFPIRENVITYIKGKPYHKICVKFINKKKIIKVKERKSK